MAQLSDKKCSKYWFLFPINKDGGTIDSPNSHPLLVLKAFLNTILAGGEADSTPPTIFFVITLITANYMVPNTWTFPNYILFKFRNKKNSIFLGGTPLRPPWKFWDLFWKNWTRDFWKWHYFFIAESFYTNKIRIFARNQSAKD